MGILLSQGADANHQTEGGVTLLERTLYFLDAFEVLLAHGADVNQQGLRGQTVLHLACNQLKHHIAVLALSYGARLDIMNDDGDTPLDLAHNIQGLSYVSDEKKSKWLELFDTFR
jgi:ankyrin repeat protein